eukprot:3043684-Alexandrium_andersonii.AAC.1
MGSSQAKPTNPLPPPITSPELELARLQVEDNEWRQIERAPLNERIDPFGTRGDSLHYHAHPAHPSPWQLQHLTREESRQLVGEGPLLSRRARGPSGTSRTLATPWGLSDAE